MNVESNFETLIKLVIIGDSGVGKSNFLFKFIEGKFSALHVATVGFDYKSKIISLPQSKKKVKLQIWDTAGQEKYMSLNKNLFQRVQGIILMYDITKRESFERLDMWLNIIKQMINEVPIVLVGNKLDDEDNEETGRIVSYTEGDEYAKVHKFLFFEASGLNGTNVDKTFINISEVIIRNMQDDRASIATVGTQITTYDGNIGKKKCIC